MAIRTWDPLGDLLKLQERLNRLIEASLSPRGLDPAALEAGWTPAADAYETAESYVVQLEVPGVDEQDVEVHVRAERVTVRGQRRPDGPARAESFRRMERTSGVFARSFVLGHRVDTGRIRTQLRDGVLRVELPKARRPGRGDRA